MRLVTFTRAVFGQRHAAAGQQIAVSGVMSNRSHRAQKSDKVSLEDTKPLIVRPLENLDDRRHNPKDIEVDEAAIRAGMSHGGTVESAAEARVARGSGGRKRSGAFGRHRVGRDISKRR